MTSILQRMGVEDAPADSTMQLSLLTHASSGASGCSASPAWWGRSCCQAFALHLGDLSQVQPILTTELLLLVLVLATWFRFRIGWREWLACIAAAGGLAGFLVFADPAERRAGPDAPPVDRHRCGVRRRRW